MKTQISRFPRARRVCLLFPLLLLLSSPTLLAEITVAPIFGSRMVLQRHQEIPIWGTATPKEDLSIQLDDQTWSVHANESGQWSSHLPAMSAGGPHRLIIQGSSRIEFNEILYGEVWLASGQSNMAMTVQESLQDATALVPENATFPEIRLFTVPKITAGSPQSSLPGSPQWARCTSESVQNFSAIAFFFGRQLHRELNVPIGVLDVTHPGAPCAAWCPMEVLRENPELVSLTVEKSLKKKNKPFKQAGKLYNGMIAPIRSFPIRGFLWYQGEADLARADLYRTLFPTLIESWRERWGQGDLPFYYVQLASYRDRVETPGKSAWAEFREAQESALSLRNTERVVSIDLGEASDLQPKNKQLIAERLATIALTREYDRTAVCSGPQLDKMVIKGSNVVLSFRTNGSALRTESTAPIRGFALAGADRRFFNAQAKLEGSTVVLSAEQVPVPIAVRYAWADNPDGNLRNQEGFPAAPFRTDRWPGLTTRK